jgi:hypothetical protein
MAAADYLGEDIVSELCPDGLSSSTDEQLVALVELARSHG